MKRIIKYIIILVLIGIETNANTTVRHYETLKDVVNRILTDKKYCKKLKIREPVLLSEFYCNNNYRFQWYSCLGDSQNRKRLMEIMDSNEFMIDIHNYDRINKLNKKCFTRKDSLLTELWMTDMALYFFKDVAYSHHSFVKYNQLHYYPDCLDFAWLLQESVNTGDFKKYIHDCEPETEKYQELKALYTRIYDSSQSFKSGKIPLTKTKLEKIKYAASLYRWLSCIQYKSCIVINLASKSISYTECGQEILSCKIYPLQMAAHDLTLTSSINNILFYYDGLYPSNLQFEFDNPLHLTICSRDVRIISDKHLDRIEIEHPGKFAELLGIDKETIQNSVCPEEATPFVKVNCKSVPLFIVNVPTDFQ